MTPFEDTVRLAEGYIHNGVKMGEGWLLTAEMLELAHSGVKNIVCTQPFGCLPNHICGKGMMRPHQGKAIRMSTSSPSTTTPGRLGSTKRTGSS